jgi:uncharacterized protein YidB (DUF937 family)
MGIFGSIVEAFENPDMGPTAISTALGNTNLGSLAGIVSQLKQGGLDKQVQSWLG